MKASEIRRLAKSYPHAELVAAAEAISEREEEVLEVMGADMGERLTHLLLAARVRERVEGGEEMRDAFRAEMASVRALLENEP